MDLQKIRVRQDLERMVINYFLMGKISREQADKIADYIDGVIGGGCLPEPAQREGKIIYFPETGQDGKPREPLKALEQRKPSFEEHCEGFKGVQFGSYYHTRIMWALYACDIHSLEELAKIPPDELLQKRDIGRKSLAYIRTTLESRGFTLGNDWDLIAGAKRHEG